MANGWIVNSWRCKFGTKLLKKKWTADNKDYIFI